MLRIHGVVLVVVEVPLPALSRFVVVAIGHDVVLTDVVARASAC